jgi:transposase
MKNQRYEKSFREEAVKLALSGGKSISQTARDLGIKESTLYSWIYSIKGSNTEVSDGTKKLSSEQLVDELTRLRKENARLKEEREILKKAAVFFAREEQKR